MVIACDMLNLNISFISKDCLMLQNNFFLFIASYKFSLFQSIRKKIYAFVFGVYFETKITRQSFAQELIQMLINSWNKNKLEGESVNQDSQPPTLPTPKKNHDGASSPVTGLEEFINFCSNNVFIFRNSLNIFKYYLDPNY